MKMQKETFRVNRRGFFKRLTLLGGGGAVLSMRPKGAAASIRSATGGPVPAKGYRVTPHIRKYYETAGM